MKVTKVIKKTKDFLKKASDSLKMRKEKEVNELNELETKLKKLEDKEKNTEDHLIWGNKTMLKFRGFALLAVFIGYIGYNSLDFIYLILSALIISIAMEAIIDFFQKRLPRWFSIILTYILLVIFMLSGIIFIIPFLASQMAVFVQIGTEWIVGIQMSLETYGVIGLIENIGWLPDYFKNLLMESFNDPNLLNDIQIKLQDNISQIVGTSTEYVKTLGSLAASFVVGFFAILWKIIFVITLSVLFSIEKDAVIKFIGKLGGKRKEYLQIKLVRLYKKLGLWLKGQLLLCLFIAIAMLVSLIIMSAFGLEIPQIGSLAVIAGLTELIPYIGPAIGGIPAVVVVLLHNGIYAAIVMVGVIALIQRLENNVLIPVVMNKTLGVNPVTIFISMILGGLIMGFVGILLAVPIAVILTIFLGGDFEHKDK